MNLRLTNDQIFKAVFGQEKDYGHLINLLNALLEYSGEEEIREIELLNPYTKIESVDDKVSILDIRARDGKGILYNIEMQINPDSSYINRIIYYAARLFSGQMKQGEEYNRLKKTISLTIVDRKNILKGNKNIHNIYYVKNDKTNEKLSDIIEFHFIELKKLKKNSYDDLRGRFEKWIYFLKSDPEEIDKLREKIKDEEGIEMAATKYRLIKSTKEELARQMQYDIEKAAIEKAYRIAMEKERLEKMEKRAIKRGEKRGIEKGMQKGMEQGIKKGMEQGIEKGMEQGIKKGIEQGIEKGIEVGIKKYKIEMALEFKKLGISISDISKGTGLSEEEIERL